MIKETSEKFRLHKLRIIKLLNYNITSNLSDDHESK